MYVGWLVELRGGWEIAGLRCCYHRAMISMWKVLSVYLTL